MSDLTVATDATDARGALVLVRVLAWARWSGDGRDGWARDPRVADTGVRAGRGFGASVASVASVVSRFRQLGSLVGGFARMVRVRWAPRVAGRSMVMPWASRAGARRASWPERARADRGQSRGRCSGVMRSSSSPAVP